MSTDTGYTSVLDPVRVTDWLLREIPAATAPFFFRHIAGGRSNLTFQVSDASGHSWALRRPPTGGVLATAHDMRREWRFLTALAPTAVPVPAPVAYCADPQVTGAEFYVMDFAAGIVLADADAGGHMPASTRIRVAESTADALVALHSENPGAHGLDDLHRPGNFVERQLRRWRRQAHSSAIEDLRLLDEVHDRLLTRIPHGQTRIVHGDFRPGNIVYAPDGNAAAVLDWELATIGDPLTDLGWLLASWRQDGDTADPITPGPSDGDGYPGRELLIHRYATGSGRDLSDLSFYIAFARWRIACILAGVHTRYRTGVMGDATRDGSEELAAFRHQLDAAKALITPDGQ
jgi:aminoglycoside phosphotransferase (APT) family kinase protein